MKVLVLGGSGATGKLVCLQLLKQSIPIRIIVREGAILHSEIMSNPLVEIKRGNITELNNVDMEDLLRDCNAIVCCLGHNITIKGIFGKPRNLVFGTIKKVCESVKTKSPIKIVLMSTTAYENAKAGEVYSCGSRLVLSILKLLLPPHRDNVKAADYLNNVLKEGTGNIEWVAVRPDTLINSDSESLYEVLKSPVRNPVFNAGTVSRINVSHFICQLLTNDDLWRKWRFRMPVVYDDCTEKAAKKN